jgi:hypothetical protein
MSEPTIADVQNDLAALRRELDGLRARMAASAPPEQDLTNIAGDAMRRHLKQSLAEKGKSSGLSVGSLINQIRGDGGAGTAFNIVTLHDASDLPTDEQITEKVVRAAAFAQNPLILRALRCLAEPYFDGQEMRRSKAELAAILGVTEADVEAALTPMLDKYGVRWGKDAAGQEYYTWSGDRFAMLLLIRG